LVRACEVKMGGSAKWEVRRTMEYED
jgi:hypothetical protein